MESDVKLTGQNSPSENSMTVARMLPIGETQLFS